MKEEIAKNLIQKSKVNTSDDFTDKLMLKVEAEKARSVTSTPKLLSFRYPLLAMIGGIVVFFMILFSGFIPRLMFFDYHLQLNKTPFLILLSFLLIMGVNHILRLKVNLENFQKAKS